MGGMAKCVLVLFFAVCVCGDIPKPILNQASPIHLPPHHPPPKHPEPPQPSPHPKNQSKIEYEEAQKEFDKAAMRSWNLLKTDDLKLAFLHVVEVLIGQIKKIEFPNYPWKTNTVLVTSQDYHPLLVLTRHNDEKENWTESKMVHSFWELSFAWGKLWRLSPDKVKIESIKYYDALVRRLKAKLVNHNQILQQE